MSTYLVSLFFQISYSLNWDLPQILFGQKLAKAAIVRPVCWLNRNMKHTVSIIDLLLFFDRLHHKLADVIWIWPLFKLPINPVFVYWSFWEKEKIRNVFWLPIRSVIQAEIMKLEMKRVYLTKAIFWAKVCTYCRGCQLMSVRLWSL